MSLNFTPKLAFDTTAMSKDFILDIPKNCLTVNVYTGSVKMCNITYSGYSSIQLLPNILIYCLPNLTHKQFSTFNSYPSFLSFFLKTNFCCTRNKVLFNTISELIWTD